jgi:hypothetical protein
MSQSTLINEDNYRKCALIAELGALSIISCRTLQSRHNVSGY